jgi:hypothetical protein
MMAATEKSNTLTMMDAATRTSTAPPRLPATVQKSLAPARRRNPFFKPGEDVEVRHRLGKVFSNRELVIYLRAKVVSVSAGTCSYLVEYPAANSVPARTARVAVFDVRAARRVPPTAVDVASSKRPLPPEQSERDCCKKVKKTGKGIPEDVLERLIAENEKEEDAKKKKNALGHGLSVPAKKKLLPAPVKALLQPSR